ncbi:MAG: peptide-binding protein [Sedimentisphaerales bacterium]|nr:peptide-binding protein [Sedimentisphaerales bacterium]
MSGNGRSASKICFILSLILIIIFLQLLSFKQTRRFNERLNSLERTLSQTPLQKPAVRNKSETDRYPGDEGDWLIWAFAVEPKTLNQMSVNRCIYSKWMTVETVFEPLLAYDYDEVKLNPHLAKSYKISDDGLEITFTLRDDIHFSDGAPITTDDVIFTYETIINPKIDAADIAQLYVDVKGFEKIDDKNIKFIMKRPYFKCLEILSFWDTGIYPKHIYDFNEPEEFNKRISNPIGSGPYVFEKWDSGDKIVFHRNENYWGEKPKIEKVVYKFIKNDKARLQALQSGDVDIMIPSPEQFVDLIRDENFTKKFRCLSYWNPGVPFYYIGWNQETSFFADKRVRLAMTHMIDRESIVEHLLKNSGKITTGPYFIHSKDYDPDIKPWPYDIKKAAQLLDEAGWKDTNGDGIRDKNGKPFRFKFSYSADSTIYQNLAKIIKDSGAKIGVDIIPDPVEWSILMVRLPKHEFESVTLGWGGDIVEDNYQIFHSSQAENLGSNYVSFKNPEADRLLEQIRQTLNEEKRIELSHKLHRLIHDEQPYTFVFTRPTYRIVSPRFENVIVHKLGLKEEEWFVPKNKQKYK